MRFLTITARDAVEVGWLRSIDFAEWSRPESEGNISYLGWLHALTREPNIEWSDSIPARS